MQIQIFYLGGNAFENFTFFSHTKINSVIHSIIAIVWSNSDSCLIVKAYIYENLFQNMESNVLKGVLSFLNVPKILISNNTFINCKAYIGGSLSIFFSFNAIVESTQIIN